MYLPDLEYIIDAYNTHDREQCVTGMLVDKFAQLNGIKRVSGESAMLYCFSIYKVLLVKQ